MEGKGDHLLLVAFHDGGHVVADHREGGDVRAVDVGKIEMIEEVDATLDQPVAGSAECYPLTGIQRGPHI